MRALLLVLLLALADSQPFRGGSLTWTRSGDRSARFVFSGAFQRSYGPFHGSAPDGKPAVGDKVVISGREPILFQDGMQGSGEQVTITVSHIDLRADAFHGTFITERSFPAQQASLGVPYLARVEGCCRVSAGSLGGSFALRAAVDFTWEVAGRSVNSSGTIAAPAIYRAMHGPDAARVFIDHAAAATVTLCRTPAADACRAVATCASDALPPSLSDFDCTPYVAPCMLHWCGETGSVRSPVLALSEVVVARLSGPDAFGPGAPGPAPVDDVACSRILEAHGAGVCSATPGCCRTSEQGEVPGGGRGCVACIAVFSDGKVHVEPATPPGLVAVSVALARTPQPKAHSCVDAPATWRGPDGVGCRGYYASFRCSHNVSGTGGVAPGYACCECGVGGWSNAAPPPLWQGMDGEYSTGCVNATILRIASGAVTRGQPPLYRSNIRLDATTGAVSVAITDFAPLRRDLSPAQLNASLGAACSVDYPALLFSAEGTVRDSTRVGATMELGVLLSGIRVYPNSSATAAFCAEACAPCLPPEAWAVGQWTTVPALVGNTSTVCNCSLLSHFGIRSDERVLVVTHTGNAGPNALGACSREAALGYDTRRSCGWLGVTLDQCEAVGCCYDNTTTTALHCFQRTFRDPPSSRLTHKECVVDPRRWWQCISLRSPSVVPLALNAQAQLLAAPSNAQIHARVGDHPPSSSFLLDYPPTAVASAEFLLDLLPPDAAALQRAALPLDTGVPSSSSSAASGLLPLNLTFRHPKDFLTADALDLASGLPANFRLESVPGAWRVSPSPQSGVVHALKLDKEGDPAGAGTDGAGASYLWEGKARREEEGTGGVCFQARVFLSCADKAGSDGLNFTDQAGLNCSEYLRRGWCGGIWDANLEYSPKGGAPQLLLPLEPLVTANEACCACGGGEVRSLWTEARCLPVAVRPDYAPEIFIAEQIEGLDPPCKDLLLGDPRVLERRCTTPVLRAACRPPFHCPHPDAGAGIDAVADIIQTGHLTRPPRRVTEDTSMGSVGVVDIISGGYSCVEGGTLRAVAGGKFEAVFEVARPGTFRGESGAITDVTITVPGSGYLSAPVLEISSGGRGCKGYSLEARLSTGGLHLVPVFPGVGMDVEMIVRDHPLDTVPTIRIDTTLPPDMARAVFHPPVIGAGYTSRRFTWKPHRSLSGSAPVAVCFSAQDSSGVVSANGYQLVPSKAVAACLSVTVIRCRYAVNEGENLRTIAAFYRTNWVQLWALNPEIRTPDMDLAPGALVSVGHIYKIERDDTVLALLRKFGAARKQFEMVNNDWAVEPDKVLLPGQSLCVTPGACGTNV